MSEDECPACGEAVSAGAAQCPSCKHPLDEGASTQFGMPTSSAENVAHTPEGGVVMLGNTGYLQNKGDDDEESSPDGGSSSDVVSPSDSAEETSDEEASSSAAPTADGSSTGNASNSSNASSGLSASSAGRYSSGSGSISDAGTSSGTDSLSGSGSLSGTGSSSGTDSLSGSGSLSGTGSSSGTDSSSGRDEVFSGNATPSSGGLSEQSAPEEMVDVLTEPTSDAFDDSELEEVDEPSDEGLPDDDFGFDDESEPTSDAAPEPTAPNSAVLNQPGKEEDGAEETAPPPGDTDEADGPAGDAEAASESSAHSAPALGRARSAPAPVTPGGETSKTFQRKQTRLGIASGVLYGVYLVVAGMSENFPGGLDDITLAVAAGIFCALTLVLHLDPVDFRLRTAYYISSGLIVGGLAVVTLVLPPLAVQPGPTVALLGAVAAVVAAAMG